MKAEAAEILSSWWAPPEPSTVTLWLEPERVKGTRQLWRRLALPGEAELAALYSALNRERDSLRSEYERLLVGPGSVPCPPYEAFWGGDRPRHEEGMVSGEATGEVSSLYTSMGLQVRSGAAEQPDHLAVELEALAYGWKNGVSAEKADLLIQEHLAHWLPSFCASVTEQTQSDFYRALARLTPECIRFWAGEKGASGL